MASHCSFQAIDNSKIAYIGIVSENDDFYLDLMVLASSRSAVYSLIIPAVILSELARMLSEG